jgi:NADPH:quinone reductase
MLALRFDKARSLDGLKLESVPRPTACSGQVVVAVHAAGLNPSDVKNVLGRFPYTTLPRTPGRDFAGVVVEGPAELVGQQVWGTGRDLGFDRDGSHAEFVLVSSNGIARLPDGLTMTDAASAGVPYTTALEALDRLEVEAGDRLLILGSGAVGTAAAVLALQRRAEPHVVVRAQEQVSALENAGFSAIFVPEGEALPSSPAIFDTTGHRLPDAIQALQRFGRVAIIAAPPTGTVEVPMLALYRKGGSIIGVNSLLHDSVECAAMLDRIGVDLESPLPGPVKQVRIEEATEAYRAVDRGDRAKFVLTMGALTGGQKVQGEPQ